LVVNATSLGMSAGDPAPVRGSCLYPGQFIYDIVYTGTTRFQEAGRAAGATVSGGLGMLLHQGARAFELWTGEPAPLDTMRRALIKAVKDSK
jgi:shikimate dehydrogenase